MCVPKEKIYNDAPDEFAAFLDSGRRAVSLKDLGGLENPFIKVGIYKPYEDEFWGNLYAECPICGSEIYIDNDFSEHEIVRVQCDNHECRADFEADEEDCIHYVIDHMALAEFISKGIGCTVCRQFQKPGWLFGKLRGYDVFFSCAPTKGMYRALTTTDKSVLIIGKNNPKLLPEGLESRIILLSRLLYVNGGQLHFAEEAIEEKIPQPRRRGRRETPQADAEPKKKQSRPPIQVYAPYYLAMIREWLETLRHDKTTGKPPYKWVTDWMHRHCHIQGVKPVGERQIRRHVDTLTASEPQNPKRDKRHPSFAVYWDGCEDKNFITSFSDEDVNTMIIKAFDVARQTGFKVRPMRNMDAADFADKVKQR